MKYTREAFDRAEEALAARRRKTADELALREEYVYKNLPEVKLLTESVRNTYFELYKIIATHEPEAAKAAELVRDKNLNTQRRIAELVKELTGDEHYLEPKHNCELCGDTGAVDGKRCKCMEELLKGYMIDELNESSTIALHDFSQFDASFYAEGELRNRMTEYLRYFVKYCEHFPQGCRSMLFMGKTGLGKTFLSSCIAKAIAEKGYSVAFGSASDFLRKIENEHFGRAEGASLDSLIEADIAIIDDLGSEFAGPFYESAVYNIINGRINLRKPTVISTNLSETQFNSRYNERIASRVFNEFMPIVFDGRDIRQQKADKLYGRK